MLVLQAHLADLVMVIRYEAILLRNYFQGCPDPPTGRPQHEHTPRIGTAHHDVGADRSSATGYNGH